MTRSPTPSTARPSPPPRPAAGGAPPPRWTTDSQEPVGVARPALRGRPIASPQQRPRRARAVPAAPRSKESTTMHMTFPEIHAHVAAFHAAQNAPAAVAIRALEALR